LVAVYLFEKIFEKEFNDLEKADSPGFSGKISTY
jgi:hypothetical protein